MKIKYYLELDVEDDETIKNLKAISTAERATLDEALRNVLQNFFAQGVATPNAGCPESMAAHGVAAELLVPSAGA